MGVCRTLLVAALCSTVCDCQSRHSRGPEEAFPIPAPARTLAQSQELSLRCARLSAYPPHWEKIDATDWHSDSASDKGLDYDAAGAHIAYWYAWLVRHDLHSGFSCTESTELMRIHFNAVARMKTGAPGAIDAMLSEAEELHSPMMTDTGQAFTSRHYERYLSDYRKLFGRAYAEFSQENFDKVYAMLDAKYAPLLSKP